MGAELHDGSMDPPPSPLTALEAASVMQDTRAARETFNSRAAAMSWIMWALILTSLAGSLAMLDRVRHAGMDNAQWGLFILANLLIIGGWAALGGLFQNAVWRAFSLSPLDGQATWKGPAYAFLAGFGLVLLNAVLRGPIQSFYLDLGTATNAEIDHNLGLALALFIGGSLLVAVTLLQGFRGYPRRPGIIAGALMMVLGHVAAFLAVPDFGAAGTAAALVLLPLAFGAMGVFYWRRG